MKISLYKTLFFLLASLPFSPKMEIIQGLKIFPQDIFLFPLSILLIFRQRDFKFFSASKPYFYLFGALLVLLFSTLYSLAKFMDVIGLVKTLKYIFYAVLLILVSKHHFEDFVTTFNKIALFTISCTLILYSIDFLSFKGSITGFLNSSVWSKDFIPTGFYNYVLSIPKRGVYETGGTHGVYGSYLTLVFMINYVLFLENKKYKSKAFLLLSLSLFNILILTSRETLLIIIVLIIALVFKDIRNFKMKRSYVYFLVTISLTVFLLVHFNVNIGIINKINYTINSISNTGTEGNISARFQLWTALGNFAYSNPMALFTGIGYNTTNFNDRLFASAIDAGFNITKWETTENFFLMFLIYGGVFSFLFAIGFWWQLIIKLKRLVHLSLFRYLFFFMTLALVITTIRVEVCCPTCL